MNAGAILTGRRIFDEELSLEQVKTLLTRMNRDRVLQICAGFNLQNKQFTLELGGWRNGQGARALEKLYSEFFKPNLDRKAAFFSECNDKRFASPFSEVGLNALFCLACVFCKENGGDQMSGVDRKHNLMRVLLAVQNKVSPALAAIQSLNACEFEQVFPLIGRSILAHRCLQNNWEFDLGRLFAFATEPAIGKQLAERAKITIDDFFKRFGLPTIDYLIMFSILWIYALTRNMVDIDLLTKGFKEHQKAFRLLIKNATSTPVKIASTLKESCDLEDAIFLSDTLITHPLTDVPIGQLVPSCSLLFNKFLRGFPYLALQSQVTPNEPITDSEAKKRGADFGHIFEGYVVWLMKQWFDRSDVQVVENYSVSPSKTGDDWSQGDLVLIHQEVAFAFEASTSRLALSFRKTGSLDECVKRYSRVTKQAYSRAKSLIEGRAFYEDRETPLPKVAKAFPCAVVFEFLPFAQPFVEPFEKRMAAEEVKAEAFDDSERIGPLQYFDVQKIEEWDEVFNLPSEIAALFSAIRERANSRCFRYQSISAACGRSGHGVVSRSGVVRKMFAASKNVVRARLGEISTIKMP